ncbi:MAG TPA: hypothetical protein VJ208_02200 [Candidatus Nanoarchaeia archaeon]|nr:hypothetical protein [Candidatus Nanoarchaeia archaeon]
MMFLQSFGFYGGSIGNLLAQWEQIGMFSYILPFLLLFALIFGILSRIKIFDNKSLNTVISLAVSLMALQYDYVPRFFSEVFPRLGVGLSIVLIVIILFGLFTDSNWTWLLSIVGVIIFIIIMANSFDIGTTSFGFWLAQNWGVALGVAIAIGLVIAVVFNPIKFEPTGDNILSQSIKNAFGVKGH